LLLLFGKTKDPASTVILLTIYFWMTSDPKVLHFGSAVAGTIILHDFPVSEDPCVPCGSQRACNYIDKNGNNGTSIVFTKHLSSGNHQLFIFMTICKYLRRGLLMREVTKAFNKL
jgi:hypothetical protein